MEINNKKNYYKILDFGELSTLGVWSLKQIPTSKEIKKQYRVLSKKYHPDITVIENASLIFREIVEAYKILSDKDLRVIYDEKSIYGSNYDSSNELYDFSFSNESDSIENIKNKFEKFNKSSMIHIEIVLDEFVEKLTYERYVLCKTCDGNGFDPEKEMFECDMCEESGEYLGNTCSMCKGNGSFSMYKCPKCNGDIIVKKTENILLKEDMFDEDGRCFIEFKGNNDKFVLGKIGHLFINIKKT